MSDLPVCAHCNGTWQVLPEKCCLTCKNKRIVHCIPVCALDRLPIQLDMVCSRWALDAEGEAAIELEVRFRVGQMEAWAMSDVTQLWQQIVAEQGIALQENKAKKTRWPPESIKLANECKRLSEELAKVERMRAMIEASRQWQPILGGRR